jgi:hypothetical protein
VLALILLAANALWPPRRDRIVRALASKPRSLVQEARGAVRLTGRIFGIGDLQHAPLSGRPCVAYEVLVDEFGTSNGPGGVHRRRWAELREANPFLVADESGKARIDTSGPFLMSLNHDYTGTTGWFSKYPGTHQALASFLSSMGIPSTNWLGRWRRFHYVEGVLEEGELVSVSANGVLELDPAAEQVSARSPPQRLVLRGTEALPLLISDNQEARNIDA